MIAIRVPVACCLLPVACLSFGFEGFDCRARI